MIFGESRCDGNGGTVHSVLICAVVVTRVVDRIALLVHEPITKLIGPISKFIHNNYRTTITVTMIDGGGVGGGGGMPPTGYS